MAISISMITRKLRKVGDSYVITIPAQLVKAYDLIEGKEYILNIKDNCIIMQFSNSPKDL